MTEFLIEYLEQAAKLALVWGPLLVLFFMTVESSFIPFPSEVVMIPAGFLAARQEFWPGPTVPALIVAILCGLIGSLLGAWINYWIGWKLGRPILHKHSKWFFLTPEKLDHAEAIFREYGDMTTFVCRFVPAIRQLISIPAGLSGMNFLHFSFFTGLGAGIWVAFLTFLGYYFGTHSVDMSYADLVHKGKDVIKHNLLWILLGCAALMGGYIWLHKRIMSHKPGGSGGAPTGGAA